MSAFRRMRHFLWLLAPILAVLIGLLYRTGTLQKHWAIIAGEPVIDYPEIIDLGERTANEQVTVRFQIGNRGRKELIIEQISGANFAFADGSVRFLSYSANPIMPALATREGGEVVALP